MRRSIKTGLIILFFVAVVSIGFSFYIHSSTAALTDHEAKEIVQTQYGGKVSQIERMKESGIEQHKIKMDIKDGKYEIILDSRDGTIISMRLVEYKGNTDYAIDEAKQMIERTTGGTVSDLKRDAQNRQTIATGIIKLNGERKKVIYSFADKKVKEIIPIATHEETSEPNTAISKERAVQIAQSKVNGTVKGVQLVETSKGLHYKIMIENDIEGAYVFIPAHSDENITYEWYQKEQSPCYPEPSDDDDQDDQDDDIDDDKDGTEVEN